MCRNDVGKMAWSRNMMKAMNFGKIVMVAFAKIMDALGHTCTVQRRT